MDHLITLTVNSTHFYLVDCRAGKLLIDAGWGLDAFKNQLRAYKIDVNLIRYVMFTHHHPDHAGLIQDIKNLSSAKLIIHQAQLPFLPHLAQYYEKKGGYTPIQVGTGDLVINPAQARLDGIGLPAEIIETPGHSPDSISLVMDNGAAFIGDLPAPDFATPESSEIVHLSWQKLTARGVKEFYHSHAGRIPVENIYL